MKSRTITYREQEDTGDCRGSSFPLNDAISEGLVQAKGCHVATILPGHIRGNHYHLRQSEILFVMRGCPWTLFWDEGEGKAPRRQEFSGEKSVLVTVFPGASHAVVNDGQAPLLMIGLADQGYDPQAPDAYRRQVTP